MKIELLIDHYANAQGLKLTGAGIHEVEAGAGAYLLATFPEWFAPVAGEEAPVASAPTVEAGDQPIDVIEAVTVPEADEPKAPKTTKKRKK